MSIIYLYSLLSINQSINQSIFMLELKTVFAISVSTYLQEMSESAMSFILRCFEPDPDKRAKASELLEDPFIAE